MVWSLIGGLAVAAFLAAWALTRYLPGSDLAGRLLDHPNERSLHHHPIPSGGGLAIGASIALCGAVAWLVMDGDPHLPWVAAGAGLIVGVSFLDDLFHVHPALRIVVHIAVAGILIGHGLAIDRLELPGLGLDLPGAMIAAVSGLFVVWFVNLYNFMDGMDGFAAGMAVVGFATLAVLGGKSHPEFTAICTVIAAAAGGFLAFNFPPARIFMGDVGSSLLGYLAAALSLWGSVDGIFPLWVAVLVFSPFVVDSTFTLMSRLWRRERVWVAHRTHCYQRLVRLGWTHRKTVQWEYALMVACAGSAVVAVRLDLLSQWLILSAWGTGYVVLIGLVRGLESKGMSDET